MAATVSIVERTVFGDQKITIADVTFDSSYPTGGESIDLELLGLTLVNFVWVSPAGGYLFEYDYADNLLLALYPTSDDTPPAVAEEVANATDLSTLTVRCMFFGR